MIFICQRSSGATIQYLCKLSASAVVCQEITTTVDWYPFDNFLSWGPIPVTFGLSQLWHWKHTTCYRPCTLPVNLFIQLEILQAILILKKPLFDTKPKHFRSFYRTQVNLGSDLWVRMSVRPSVSTWCFWNLTDVTLADEDTKSILTDNANRAIQGNVPIQVTQPGGEICN